MSRNLEARLRELAEGCAVHGVGFICRHTWEDLEGPAFDLDRTKALEGARERLAEAGLDALRRLSRAEELARHQAREIDDYERRLSELEQEKERLLFIIGELHIPGQCYADGCLACAALSGVERTDADDIAWCPQFAPHDAHSWERGLCPGVGGKP